MRPGAILLTLAAIISCGLLACDNGTTPASTAPDLTGFPTTLSSTPPATMTEGPANPNATTSYPEGTVIPPDSESPEPSATATETNPYQNFKVAGYITHWHLSRLASMKLEGLTHLIWQGIEVTDSGDPTLRVLNSAGWWQIDEVVTVGHANGAKVLVSLIGLWKESKLSEIWKSPQQREKLIDNLKDLVESYGLDGIDIDNENRSCDKITYSTFVKELYDVLSPMGKIITMAGSPYKVCITPETFPCVEFVNLMTYDMAAGKGYPYHSTLEESIQAIDLWVSDGVPKEKLLMGIPVYGRDGDSSHFEYWWIVEKYNPSPGQNEVSEPMAAGGIIWWNGIDLVKEKVLYILENDFGGAMLYELGTDSQGSSSLLESIFQALEQSEKTQNVNTPGSTEQHFWVARG